MPIGRPNCLRSKRVVAGRFVGALRQADRQRRDADAAGVEHLQRLDEALPFFADQLGARDAAVLKDHFGRFAGAHAELVFLLAGEKAWRAALDDERRDAFVALALVGDGHDDHRVARAPCVMNALLPFSTQPSPSATAVVRIAAASLPDPGSVSPHAASFSPRASGSRKRRFCASLPNIEMCAAPRPLCAATDSDTLGSTRASSSMQMQ